jgi:hypothetical protein
MLLETVSFARNVSALVWDLNTKNTYNLSGNFKYSYVNASWIKGISTSLNMETSGQYRYSLGADLVTKDFDNNDQLSNKLL